MKMGRGLKMRLLSLSVLLLIPLAVVMAKTLKVDTVKPVGTGDLTLTATNDILLNATNIDASASTYLVAPEGAFNEATIRSDAAVDTGIGINDTSAFVYTIIGGSQKLAIGSSQTQFFNKGQFLLSPQSNTALGLQLGEVGSKNTGFHAEDSDADLHITADSVDVMQLESTQNIMLVDTAFNSETASTVPYLDADKKLTSSAVTPTELGYVSGVTSAIQTQIDTKQATMSGTANEIEITGGDTIGIVDNPVLGGTDAMVVPKGTTGERVSTTDGAFRFNTTESKLEVYHTSQWNDIAGSGGADLSAVTQDLIWDGGGLYDVGNTTNFTAGVYSRSYFGIPSAGTTNFSIEANNFSQNGYLFRGKIEPASGYMFGYTTKSVSSGTSEDNLFFTGTGSSSGSSGAVVIESGDVTGSGSSGNINIETGSVGSGSRGSVYLNGLSLITTGNMLHNGDIDPNTDSNNDLGATGLYWRDIFVDEVNTRVFTASQETTPANPSALHNKLYFKSDDNLYKLDSSGEEVMVSSVMNTENVTDWTSYTPTTAALGTLTTEDFKYRRVGDSVEISGYFTSGTATASEAQIGLPSGLTIDSNFGSNIYVGSGKGATATYAFGVLATGGDTFLNFTQYNAGVNVPQNGNSVFYNSVTNSFTATVKVQGWESITKYAHTTCEGLACFNEFSADVTDGASTTTVGGEGVDWINGNCTNGSAGSYVCTFTTSLFSSAPNCFCNVGVGSDGTCTAVATASNVTMEINNSGTKTDRDFNLFCQRGDDFLADDSRFIEVNESSDEYFYIEAVSNFWDSAGAGEDEWDHSLIRDESGTIDASASSSELITISDVSGQTRITAKKDIILDLTVSGQADANRGVYLYNSSGQELASNRTDAGSHEVSVSASVKVSSGDWVRVENSDPVTSRNGMISLNPKMANREIFLGNVDPTGFVKTDGVASPKFVSAHVADGASTTTVSREYGNFINGNCSNGSAGSYTCTFEGGYWTAVPNCYCEADDADDDFDCGTHGESTASVNIETNIQTSGALTDKDFKLFCHGY